MPAAALAKACNAMMANTSPQKLLGEKKPDGLRKLPTGDIAETPLHPGLFVEHCTSQRLGDEVAMALADVTGEASSKG